MKVSAEKCIPMPYDSAGKEALPNVKRKNGNKQIVKVSPSHANVRKLKDIVRINSILLIKCSPDID